MGEKLTSIIKKKKPTKLVLKSAQNLESESQGRST